MRAFAAVIFRRVASKTRKVSEQEGSKELFLTLPDSSKLPIRSALLECLAKEQVTHVRNKVADAVAELARQYYDSGRCIHSWVGRHDTDILC